MTYGTETSTITEYVRRARAILYVGLSVALAGSVVAIAFSLLPDAISTAELWLASICATVSILLLVSLARSSQEHLPAISAAAVVFFNFCLVAGSLIALFETGKLSLMLAYLIWFYPLVAFNKFTMPGKASKAIDYLLIFSSVFVFGVYLFEAELAQLRAPIGFILSFVAFALFLDIFAQYRERYIGESERRRTLEEASTVLRHNDNRVRQLFNRTGTGIGHLSIDGIVESCNRSFLDISGFEGSLGRKFADLLHPDDRPAWEASFSALVKEESASYEFEGRLARNGADPRLIHANFVFMPASEFLPQTVMFFCQDVTGQRTAEEKLRQTQKIESLGQLTGGVAHDFNNLLTVILGSGEILLHDASLNARGKVLAQSMVTAAERGADLTKRLLAFARRQPLEPKIINANQLIQGIEDLLRRTLNEDIDIDISGAGDLWHTEVDPGQLEAALVNLAVNARDAMPDGGKLTIETANTVLDKAYAKANAEVAAGEYVMLSVTDTGTGMTRETLERAFEPFFTTKETTKGNGLGLSMVFGFVRQSGGHAKIYSELGEGTCVKIYLPRCLASGPATELTKDLPSEETGAERILVVEDDELVRQNVVQQLTSLGYRVTGATSAHEALDILKTKIEIDLLFTDVVMPGGMNGRQLSEAAAKLRPNLKVLFTSGYTENAIVHQGRLNRGIQLLSKPYRHAELASKIRAVLDAG